MSKVYTYRLKVYYADTDFTGVVYYANYLRFMECARSEALGTEGMRRDYEELGVGLVVYKADVTFLRSARYGDELEVRTRGYTEGEYRLFYDQTIYRVGEEAPLIKALIQAAQVDRDGKLIPLRAWVQEAANAPG